MCIFFQPTCLLVHIIARMGRSVAVAMPLRRDPMSGMVCGSSFYSLWQQYGAWHKYKTPLSTQERHMRNSHYLFSRKCERKSRDVEKMFMESVSQSWIVKSWTRS
ncbi:hypothetical protein QBC32DRAFT_12611 [Pseudoneurospora amorphoporcata]|uniref:Secreted protein n=1 Tax=Pseudoneurospora amorphoporcata TaxID=241081 RepID=A0AAN6NRG5_9PEZI|nr:hypothetical protein QBC32DRAFT_12611 [Pseudoneurospora amorphoporcata]